MSRKKLYLIIAAVCVVVGILGILLNIKPIAVTLGVMNGMADEWQIWATAILCAFVFSRVKHYWITMVGCSLIASLLYQAYLFNPLISVDFYTVCVRALLFIAIVFGIDYLRLIFKR